MGRTTQVGQVGRLHPVARHRRSQRPADAMTGYPREDPYLALCRPIIDGFNQQFDLLVETCRKNRNSYLEIIDQQSDEIDDFRKKAEALAKENKALRKQLNYLPQSE